MRGAKRSKASYTGTRTVAEAPADYMPLGGPEPTQGEDGLAEHIRQQLDDFRRKLLDPSLRNPLLSFSYREPSTAFVRIVDELPDPVFERLEGGGEFVIRSLDPPRTEPEDEETESFQEALGKFKVEDPVYREALESLQRRRAGRAAGRRSKAGSRTGRSRNKSRTISSSMRSHIASNMLKLSFLYSISGSRWP